MECKSYCKNNHLSASKVLISTYWNVNIVVPAVVGFLGLVLISTYWNVNIEDRYSIIWRNKVLISTYWNVNWEQRLGFYGYRDCFNLNLLECKFEFHRFCFCGYTRFNLNLLECKSIIIDKLSVLLRVLISTYWNVNEQPMWAVKRGHIVLISTYWNVNPE